jgi:hypothetical protein
MGTYAQLVRPSFSSPSRIYKPSCSTSHGTHRGIKASISESVRALQQLAPCLGRSLALHVNSSWSARVLYIACPHPLPEPQSTHSGRSTQPSAQYSIPPPHATTTFHPTSPRSSRQDATTGNPRQEPRTESRLHHQDVPTPRRRMGVREGRLHLQDERTAAEERPSILGHHPRARRTAEDRHVRRCCSPGSIQHDDVALALASRSRKLEEEAVCLSRIRRRVSNDSRGQALPQVPKPQRQDHPRAQEERPRVALEDPQGVPVGSSGSRNF